MKLSVSSKIWSQKKSRQLESYKQRRPHTLRPSLIWSEPLSLASRQSICVVTTAANGTKRPRKQSQRWFAKCTWWMPIHNKRGLPRASKLIKRTRTAPLWVATAWALEICPWTYSRSTRTFWLSSWESNIRRLSLKEGKGWSEIWSNTVLKR